MSWNIAFHSGMSTASDMRACIDTEAPIGVVAGLLTNVQLFLSLPRYLDRGGKVFIDSGAFTAYRKNEPVNWERVFCAYESIINATITPEGLTIVAPDVVGDQEATMALWRVHASRIARWVSCGARVIMPLQTGVIPANSLLGFACQILGTTKFAVGIPSNLAAMSAEESGTIIHHDFHVLGRVIINEEIEQKIQKIKDANPSAFVTADANWLRARTKKLNSVPTTKPSIENCFRTRRSQAVAGLLEAEMYRFG